LTGIALVCYHVLVAEKLHNKIKELIEMAVAKESAKKKEGTKSTKKQTKGLLDTKTRTKKAAKELKDRTYCRFNKSKSRDVVVEITTYKGERKLDIREHTISGDYIGPTKTGVNVPIEMAVEIRDALIEICNEYKLEDGE
jgi:hypothetical protein